MTTMDIQSARTEPSPRPAAHRRRRRLCRPPPAPSNVLILVVPLLVLHSSLLPAFHAHFASYGTLHAWTPLPGLGRVVCVYDEEREAQAARDEMDGFYWADEADLTARGLDPEQAYEPLRCYYGPSFPPARFVHLPSHSHDDDHPAAAPGAAAADHLEVPSSGRNFLISPPGSPPVGWQQVEEDSPNTATWHPGDEPPTPRSGLVELDALKKAAAPDEAWADELARALRFLSVDVGGGDDDDEEGLEDDDDGFIMQDDDDDDDNPELGSTTTHLVLAPAPIPSVSSSVPKPVQLRPAVTVSSPLVSVDENGTGQQQPPTPPSTTATPPPGASRITSVKATIEAMLPRRGDEGADELLLDGRERIGGPRFIPTARPPVQ